MQRGPGGYGVHLVRVRGLLRYVCAELFDVEERREIVGWLEGGDDGRGGEGGGEDGGWGGGYAVVILELGFKGGWEVVS